MATLDKKRLGDILVRSGKITYDQLNEALILVFVRVNCK